MKEFFKKIVTKILIFESILVLKKYNPKIVAITGSVGKTSTKDAVYAVLAKFVHVRKSEKSYNSQIGLPLTILGLPNAWGDPLAWLSNIAQGFFLLIGKHKYPEWLVLEVGVGKPGDMAETASWLKTDAVIITAIGETPVHIEFFNSRKHLIEEKSGLIKTLKKDGVLILNKDDEAVYGMRTKTKNRVVTYGFSDSADVVASNDSILYSKDESTSGLSLPVGVNYRIDYSGASFPVVIEGVFGRNHVYASLASLTLAIALKLGTLESINSLKNYSVPPGRMCLLKGAKNTLIIDDTYNSSPFAALSALETLGGIKIPAKYRKIAVLGDMLELGKHTEEAHKHIGQVAKENADILVVVGPRAKFIKEGAVLGGMSSESIYEEVNSETAGQFLLSFIRKGDLVLVKGSQGVRMERTVEAILVEPDRKKEFLVRQDPEWLAKR